MAHYAFNTPMLTNELPGWQDTLSCPFCLNVAVECIRLPHAEPDRDCGVCACAACVREWITFSNHVGLVCPRCRHPICEVHLKNVCDQPNPGDPLLTRLLADVVTQCPHCDVTGTVSVMTRHGATHVVEQHLNTLHTIDTIVAAPPDNHRPDDNDNDNDEDEDHYSDVEMDDVDHDLRTVGSTRWLNAILALHAADPKESARYLTTWITAFLDIDKRPPPALLNLLFGRMPMHVLDVCQTVWKSTPTCGELNILIDCYRTLAKCTHETWHGTVHNRLANRFVEAFACDDPGVLLDLVQLQSSLSSATLQYVSGKALGPFALRLHTMGHPTHTHSELLFSCVTWDTTIDVDEQDLTDRLSPILKRPDLDQWWSDDLIARCIHHAATDGSQLYPMLERFIRLWLFRRAKPLLRHEVFSAVMASLVSGVCAFDGSMPMAVDLYKVFHAISRYSPSVIERIFRSPMAPSIWMAFAHDAATRHDNIRWYPLMLTPHMAREMRLSATTDLGFSTHMERILTHPLEVARFNCGATPQRSWLGHFTLAIQLFVDVGRFKWDSVPNDFVETLLKAAVENPTWWNRTMHPDPDWTWASVVVRLLCAFPHCHNRWACIQAAGAVAHFLGNAVDARTITSGNWTTAVPIFPYVHDLVRVLSLMRDEDVTKPSVLPVLAMAITEPGAILNRFCAVWSGRWTVGAITQMVRLADANAVSTLAWDSWFESTMQRNVQCAAVQTADPTPSKRSGPAWVTLLRIHALIPTECAPPPCPDTLARLLSNQAGTGDVHQALTECVLRPTQEVRAQMDHWAHACSLHNKPALFVLERLRRYCAKCVHPPNHPYAAIAHSAEGFGGMVGQSLSELASADRMRDAGDALWFVVHYAADDVLIATAARWVTNHFGGRLQALRFFPDDMVMEIVSCLNARCALLDPRSDVVDSLCMGLDMMLSRGVCRDKYTYDDTMRTKTMLGLLGGADNCHFLFIKLVASQRWTAWAILVLCDSSAWQRFVRGTPDGRKAAQCVFQHLPQIPAGYPERIAWQDTCTAVGVFSDPGMLY
jgi:hypothetical protein